VASREVVGAGASSSAGPAGAYFFLAEWMGDAGLAYQTEAMFSDDAATVEAAVRGAER